jgi:hypothetical protein
MIAALLAAAEGPCLPPPVPRTLAQIVQPLVSAPRHEDAIYVIIQVAPYGLDIRSWTFSAVAQSKEDPKSHLPLVLEPPHRVSGPEFPAPIRDEPKAFWLIRIARPRVTSQVILSYQFARNGETPSGLPCQNPPFRGSFPPFDATPD